MRWRLGEPLYLAPELEADAREVQEDHRARHPWEGLIAAFLEEQVPEDWAHWSLDRRRVFEAGNATYEGPLVPRTRICAAEIWCEVLGKQRGDMRQRDTREINDLLEQMPGWANVGVRFIGESYGKQRCFDRRPEATL